MSVQFRVANNFHLIVSLYLYLVDMPHTFSEKTMWSMTQQFASSKFYITCSRSDCISTLRTTVNNELCIVMSKPVPTKNKLNEMNHITPSIFVYLTQRLSLRQDSRRTLINCTVLFFPDKHRSTCMYKHSNNTHDTGL